MGNLKLVLRKITNNSWKLSIARKFKNLRRFLRRIK